MKENSQLQARSRTLIIMVNWMRPVDTMACVDSLRRQSFRDFDIVVVDNKSPDGSFELMRNFLRKNPDSVEEAKGERSFVYSSSLDSKVFLVEAPGNLGFAGGNNFGLRQVANLIGCNYSHFWFLNNDTEPDPDCLGFMLARMSFGEKIGIVGSTQIYFFDKKTVQVLGGSVFKPFTGLMEEIGNGTQWPQVVDEASVEKRMDYVCGASMLVRSELIRDVGMMSEDYFIFFEEIDWCERARKAGYDLAYASQAVVFHKEGASIGTGSGLKRSLLAEYYGMRNKLLITRRFFPWALPSVWCISWLQVLRRLTQRRPGNAWLMAKVLFGAGKRPV